MSHPALAAGNTAVVTGGASGIGLAAARRFSAMGMNVVLADAAGDRLDAAAKELHALVVPTDVSDFAQVEALRDAALARFGSVEVLMNNAGIGGGGGPMENLDRWRRLLDVNLFGVLHGVQAFGPGMAASGRPGLIVNTGSKQGITTPPGDTAYNVSKAGVKVLTEALAHSLRETPGCKVTAHLLVPGFVWTGMTSRGRAEKPDAAWTPEQTVDYALARIAAGDFYILCPDNDVARETDEKRIRWAAEDLASNRPALSRWHPDWKDAFAKFMAED